MSTHLPTDPNGRLETSGDALPHALTELDQWVLWRYEDRHGRRTKIPCQPDGGAASVSDSATWNSYAKVCEVRRQNESSFAGIGFVFTAHDPYAGVDLDNCFDGSSELKPWACPLIERFSSTYMEVSPSGKGVKIFVKGRLPGRGKRKDLGDHAIEVYDNGRFFTVTGQVLDGAPRHIEDHQAEIENLYKEISGGRANKRFASKGQSAIPHEELHDTLVSYAGTMRRRGFSLESIELALWQENCAKGERPYGREHVRKIAESARTWEPQSDAHDLLPYLHNDEGNASRLIQLHGRDIRYCHALKKWLVWDGRRWAVDVTDQVRRLATETMREFRKQGLSIGDSNAVRFARGSLNVRRISNMLSMAEFEIFVTPEQLDKDLYLLNFENGTVDLRTSALRPHDRKDLITKLVHYSYRPDAQCPRWRAFLDRIMGGCSDAGQGDMERARRLTDYLQRALGYSLTGSAIEKVFFMPFGNGNNGKSTMLTTYRQLIEEYAVVVQADTLMARQESNNTQADLADLRGARFAQTSETEEGQRLSQSKLKRITQGMGTIKAVRKYENPIEFKETHKIWMDTNRKPTIRDADDAATFNRLHPIPFTVQIPNDEIDKRLPEKLLAEAEGILAWAVAGAKSWHELGGLDPPPEVKAANDEWRAEMDQLAHFIEQCCILGKGFTAQASALFYAYKGWCESNGESSLTNTAFGRKLGEKGFCKRHVATGTQYEGIGLTANPDGSLEF